MNNPFKLILAGAAFSMLTPGVSLAQEVTAFEIEEIVVTGRKREENLQDVPVSISVVGADLLAEQNVLDLGDLAELVPGLNYSQGEEGPFDDRIAGLASIRGVGSTEIATNRTKVSSFVDGMPIIGAAGAINIGGSTQVEIYNGPQSAAFGRSTFAGAINYVTSDPGEETQGSVGLNLSDQGTRIINGSVGGPITDTLGYQIGASYEDSVSPDSSLYTYSDGFEGDTRGGNNISARLVWTPTDNFKTKLTFSHDETDDGPTPNFFATQESSLECFNSLDSLFAFDDGMGPAGGDIGVRGTFDCDLEIDRSATPLAVNDIIAFYDGSAEGAAILADQVSAAVAAGATGDVEGDIRAVAAGYSVDDPGSKSERDRVLLQSDYLFDDGSALQFSFMKSEDFYSRFVSGSTSTEPFDITFNAMTGNYAIGLPMGMGAESDPTEAEETYVEVRWASPGEDRLRYLVGASYYDYSFLTSIFRGGYPAVEAGTTDQILALTGTDVSVPGTILGEDTVNTAAFFNVSYDFSDKLTGSLEGRYSDDDVGASNPANGVTRSQTTTSFVPRVALNYSPNEDTTLYLQYAVGVNPAGVSSALLNEEAIALINNGIPVDLNPNDGIDNIQLIDTATYSADDFLFYEEETLTNLEFGFKGSALDGRLSYTGAIYFMEWEDAQQNVNLDWSYEFADDDLVGTEVEGMPGTFYVPEIDNTDARVTTNAGTSETKGLELQGNYFISDDWSVSANLSLMDAKYTDFCNDANGSNLGQIAGLVESVNDAGSQCFIVDGNEIANQPSLTFGLSPSYRTELANGMNFSSVARINYRGSAYTNVENITKSASSTTLNLTFGLSKDAWSGSFYIQNVFDDTSVSSANLQTAQQFLGDYPDAVLDESLFFSEGANTYANYSMRYPTGRNFGLRVNYRF